MEEVFYNIIDYLLIVIQATAIQLLYLLGPLLILAVIMNFLSGINENLGLKVFGRKIYLYGFSWLGTSIHELGHAIFAIIFGHKITKMSLFSPNLVNGSVGYVNHSYNPKNIYHNIGNFFIGIGPVIFGSFVMYALAYLFFGSYIKTLNANLSMNTLEDVVFLLKNMFIKLKTSGWKSVIILYVLYSIGSSITLSKQDLQSARKGLIYFILVVLIFNLVTLWLGKEATRSIVLLSKYLFDIYAMLILSILLNIIFIVFLYILNSVKSIFI